MTQTKDYADWEWDYNTPDTRTVDEKAAAVAAEQELQRRFVAAIRWTEETEDVTVQQDWWRAVVRPGVDAFTAARGWKVFVGEHTDRHGNPYPTTPYFGEYVGWVSGEAAPTPEAVAEMVAAWQEDCE